ncbi:MAG: hypothetical protein QOK29_4695, partial [Rhodospirillaceae bacterium]|nr:hypothetical protein [Rhodospirillaceae bacterium]
HFAIAGIIVLFTGWLLTMRVGSFSLFWLPHRLIPGAGAIRVGGRMQILVNLWIVAGLALLVDRWLRTGQLRNRYVANIAAVAVFLFCMVEQIDLIHVGLHRASFLNELAAVPAPPKECHSFLIMGARNRPSDSDQNDATWISMKTGLPTLNGTSGWYPPSWNLNSPSIDYLTAARDWIEASNLPGQVCLYDKGTRRWSPFYPQKRVAMRDEGRL